MNLQKRFLTIVLLLLLTLALAHAGDGKVISKASQPSGSCTGGTSPVIYDGATHYCNGGTWAAGSGGDGSLDINGLSTITNPVTTSDFVPSYNAAASANRKVKISDLRSDNAIYPEDHGAVGDGLTNDFTPIKSAVNACTGGKTVRFRSGRTYLFNNNTGNFSTDIKIPASCTIDLNGATIDNQTTLNFGGSGHYTFRGNDYVTIIGPGKIKGGPGAFTADNTGPSKGPRNVLLQGFTIEGVSASNPAPSYYAVYAPMNPVNIRILDVNFLNVGGGIWLGAPDGAEIRGCYFDTSTVANFIKLDQAYGDSPSFSLGHGIIIRDNKGQRCYRMGIEIQGFRMPHVVVDSNHFWNWATTTDIEPYGISIVNDSGTSTDGTFRPATVAVSNNTIEGKGGQAAYGIELGPTNAHVWGNSVRGFTIGVGIQARSGITFENNVVAECTYGLEFGNPVPYTHARQYVRRNTFEQNKNYDIYWNNIWPNGVDIKDNIFRRTIGTGGKWTTYDAGGGSFYTSLGAVTGGNAAGTGDGSYKYGVNITGNRFYQLGTSPAGGFTYKALLIATTITSAGAFKDSVIAENKFYNEASSAQGTAIHINSANVCDTCRITGNYVLNYAADVGGTALGAATITGNNISSGVTTKDALFSSGNSVAGTCRIYSGSGTPEGAVTGNVCDLYLRTDGGMLTTLYVKTSGSGNTGWTSK